MKLSIFILCIIHVSYTSVEKEECDIPLESYPWNMPKHLSNKRTVPVEETPATNLISPASRKGAQKNDHPRGSIVFGGCDITPQRARGSNVFGGRDITPQRPLGSNVFGGHDIAPQRTLTGKCVSSVCTPKHVYRAFGMHRGVSHQIQRSWNHTFDQPVHEMSTRNRNRLLQLVTPAVEKMFRAFAEDAWESLLFYVSNNVLLHQRGSKRSNKSDRTKEYHDVVYLETLARSQMVKHIVDAFNQVQGNSRRARDERRRLLSTIALDFPFRVICNLPWKIPDVGTKYKARQLTRHMFREARAHAGAFTPGGHPIFLPHVKSVKISAEMITKVYNFITQGNRVQKLASGSHDLVLSTGERFTIPPVARRFLRCHLWASFARAHTDENGNYNGGVSRADFLEIGSTATSEQEKCYSALDQIKVRCGTENFESGFQLVQTLCAMSPTTFVGYEETLKRLMTEHKLHCKSVLPTHLSTTSKCARHCLTNLFGGQGPMYSNECCECGDHPERCMECETGEVIILMIQKMIYTVSDIGTFATDTIEDLQWRLDK